MRLVYASVVQTNQNILLQIGSDYRQISWRMFILKQKKGPLWPCLSLFRCLVHFYKGHKTFYN